MNQEFSNTTINQMTKAAWQISYTSLWNSWRLSDDEVTLSKCFIRNFILTQPMDHYKAYQEFCERVLLAREFLIKNPDRYVPLPSKWFSRLNVNGFAGTARWYTNTEDIRKVLPLYRNQFKALPEAILEMTEEPCMTTFHYWREWFTYRNKQATANLFLSIVFNCIFC